MAAIRAHRDIDGVAGGVFSGGAIGAVVFGKRDWFELEHQLDIRRFAKAAGGSVVDGGSVHGWFLDSKIEGEVGHHPLQGLGMNAGALRCSLHSQSAVGRFIRDVDSLGRGGAGNN